MNTRRNQILAALAVVQVIVVAIVLYPRSNASAATTEPLLPDVATGALTAFTITDGDGKSLALAKDGDKWVLPNADGYPADETKVEELLEKLGHVTGGHLATKTSGSHRRLKVHDEEFERRLDLTMGGEHVLLVGSSVGSRSSHVRLDGANEVYLAKGISSWQMSVTENSWIDTVYLKIEKDDITHVLLRNDNGVLEFDKSDEGVWSLAGVDAGDFKDTKLTTLLNRVSSLRMSKPLGREEKPEYGLAQPAATVTVTTKVGEDGEDTYTVKVGARASDDDDFVVRSSTSNYHVEVSKWTAEEFTTQKREDFIEAAADGS
jgi:hypothetical protein